MASQPLISVIIPMYNVAAYVAQTLESVIAQTWRPLEAIVVDDGSTDETPSIAEQFASAGVRVIRQTHGGQCAAINVGLRTARGAFLHCMDADDVIPPDFFACQIASLGSDPRAVAYGSCRRFWVSLEDAGPIEPTA